MSVTMFKYSETCTQRVLSENILKYLNMHRQIRLNPTWGGTGVIMNQANENVKLI